MTAKNESTSIGCLDAVQHALFDTDSEHLELHAYALLDGAAIPNLLDQLDSGDDLQFECLYWGDLQPDMAECAPYLVRLVQGHPFNEWLVGEGWGNHWGIYVVSSLELGEMRRHFRRYLMVKGPDGAQRYFRFYDPRVLGSFSKFATKENVSRLFGPLSIVLLDTDGKESIRVIENRGGGELTDKKFAPEILISMPIERPFHGIASPSGISGMTITSEEFAAFDEEAARKFRSDVTGHIAECFPDDDRVLKADDFPVFVADEIDAAKACGMETEYDIVRYVQVSFLLGSDFPTQHRWAARILRDPELAPTDKMDLLFEEAEKLCDDSESND